VLQLQRKEVGDELKFNEDKNDESWRNTDIHNSFEKGISKSCKMAKIKESS
jgi:hypothetical protein